MMAQKSVTPGISRLLSTKEQRRMLDIQSLINHIQNKNKLQRELEEKTSIFIYCLAGVRNIYDSLLLTGINTRNDFPESGNRKKKLMS